MYVHALMGCMCEPEGSLSIAVSMYVVISIHNVHAVTKYFTVH